MKSNTPINNLQELKQEIARLKLRKREQEAYLTQQFDILEEKITAPARLLSRITGFFNTVADKSILNFDKSLPGGDWFSNSLRIALPFLFNKVLFKKAGVIKKGLLLIASQQAASLVNKEQLTALIKSVTSLIRNGKKDRRREESSDFGIPPDSETS